MAGERHLRLVPPPRPTPKIKDITGEGIQCACICGLWRHAGICLEEATIEERLPTSRYPACKPCYEDMQRKEIDL